MKYDPIVSGRFLARPNRFIAHVDVGGEQVVAHVKNTGRCRELLTPGARLYLQDWGKDHTARKTRYDVIAVEKGTLLVNMDSQAPNKVFAEWANSGGFVPGLTLLRPETTWGSSRFDFYWETKEKRGFTEVKGVTLEENGHVRFPDAPTERGVKHLEELIRAKETGYEAAVCFVIQMEGMRCFSPNDETHPAFGAALRKAAKAGVRVLAMECHVTPETLEITQEVPVVL
ncbi:MAG: DNA/RNA nuclease SfsA [Oscillospiraceae bacterium]